MKSSRFIVHASILTLLFLTPFIGFVSLKYHGLDDGDTAYYTTTEEETGTDVSLCRTIIQFGTFRMVADWEVCHAFVCTLSNECAVIVGKDAEKVEYSQSEAALNLAKELSGALQEEVDAERAEMAAEVEAEREAHEAKEDAELAVSWWIGRYANYLNNINYGYAFWQWGAIFSLSFTFCALGFTTSLLTRDGRRFPQSDRRSIVLLTLFSAVTGLLIVALFAGGLIQGTLFPDFTGDELNFGFNSWVALKFRGPDWFKLAIWAYIAGFHERFLPDILTDLVNRKRGDEPSSEAGRERM